MGIECGREIICKTQDEFHTVDKIVTGCAFDIHNEYGRFCDEKIYQEILAQKCRNSSIEVEREVELGLSYKNFRKIYRIDLLVDDGIIYELKAVDALNHYHKQQLINYLLLADVKHGKLLNFGSASVEYEFVSTSLSVKDRYNYSVDDREWKAVTEKCAKLKILVFDLLQEWGAFLDYRLYAEAITFFLGADIVRPVELYFEGHVVGSQKMVLLDNETVLHMSAVTRSFKGHENNIKRFIRHTNIRTVQWINMNHRNIKLKTIKNDSVTNDSVKKRT